eukprot:3004505-Pleurochrysis_carterae.AAC.1
MGEGCGTLRSAGLFCRHSDLLSARAAAPEEKIDVALSDLVMVLFVILAGCATVLAELVLLAVTTLAESARRSHWK